MKAMTAFMYRHRLKLIVVVFLLLLVGIGAAGILRTQRQASVSLERARMSQESLVRYTTALASLRQFKAELVGYQNKGLDITSVSSQNKLIEEYIQAGDYAAAETIMVQVRVELGALFKQKEEQLALEAQQKLEEEQKAQEAEKQKAQVSGIVTADAKPAEAVQVSLELNGSKAGEGITDAAGSYSLRVPPGAYTLTASKSGYITVKTTLTLQPQQIATLNITLLKPTPVPTRAPTPTPTPTPTSNPSSNSFSSYERKSIVTSRGTFTVDLVSLNLGSGKVRVITDAASDTDCLNNCPAKSLQSYVSANGGFAGMNGTYFCPPDYADCAGKTNWFFWKVYNTRLGTMINASNGSGEDYPFMAFDSSGSARYFSTWNSFMSSGFAAVAGINCGPRLVEGGRNAIRDEELDSKQRTTKSNRGALALKGQVLYAIVAKSATIPDLAEILVAMGADSGLNLDGGGSSALYYNGYKVGPGRSLPNAIVFAAR